MLPRPFELCCRIGNQPGVLARLLLLLVVGFRPVPVSAQPDATQPDAARPDSLLRMSPVRRYVAITDVYYRLLQKDTVAARQMRQELITFFGKKGSEVEQAQVELALLEIERALQVHPERFLAPTTALLRQAEEWQDTLLLGRAHFNVGLYYFRLQKAYYLAFRHFGQAFDYLRNRSEANFPNRDYALYSLGLASYEFFDYPRAIELGRTLHQSRQGAPKQVHIFNACLVGLSHLKRQEYDSARFYFEWGLRQLPVATINNEAWEGIFNGNLGRVLAERGQREAALPSLKKGLDFTARAELWDNVAPFGALLSTLHLPVRPDLALAYARQAHRAARRLNQARILYETHRALSASYAAVKQPHLALAHADSAARAKEDWQAEIDVTLKHRAEIVLETERHQARERLLQREKDRQVLLRNGLLLLIALATGLAYLLYNRRELRQRQRQLQVQAEQERREAELQQALTQLAAFTQGVQEKTALIEQMSPAADTPDELPPAYQEVLDQLRHSVLLTNQSWAEFSALFERVHAGFFSRLDEKYPGLSPAETRFVALSKLGCSSQEMAAMLGVGADAIRQYRSRLRRKLQLPDEANLDEAIAELLRV